MQRLRASEGFGLVELLIAMVVLNIGLLALIAAFSSGALALTRASKTATGASLADQQLEIYRAMPYPAIGLDTNVATDATYKADSACPNHTTCSNVAPTSPACSVITGSGGSNWGLTNACTPSRTISSAASPDRLSYRVDTYVRVITQSGQRDTKQVTVVVRDGANTAKTLARVSSLFDCSTGQIPNAPAC